MREGRRGGGRKRAAGRRARAGERRERRRAREGARWPWPACFALRSTDPASHLHTAEPPHQDGQELISAARPRHSISGRVFPALEEEQSRRDLAGAASDDPPTISTSSTITLAHGCMRPTMATSSSGTTCQSCRQVRHSCLASHAGLGLSCLALVSHAQLTFLASLLLSTAPSRYSHSRPSSNQTPLFSPVRPPSFPHPGCSKPHADTSRPICDSRSTQSVDPARSPAVCPQPGRATCPTRTTLVGEIVSERGVPRCQCAASDRRCS